ncbi:MAG: GGDEF domain-containing protein [Candidatus Cloacimonetes bacterium]|nr:GGDEF domain-containing protein [Candidatus Cloacimonadota bacterium]
MTEALLGQLQSNFLFHSITPDVLKQIDEAYFRHQIFHKGDILIRPEDASYEIFLIIEGFVEIIKSKSDKTREQLLQKGPGEFLGEVSLLLSVPRNATVTCITDVEVFIVSAQDMRSIIRHIPSVRKNILKNIIETVFSEDQRVVREIIQGNLMAEMFNAVSLSTKQLERLNRKLKQTNMELDRKNKKLYELATYDSLTKIYNRAFVMDMFSREFSKSQRHNLNLTCLLIDVDNFKLVNDNFGHLIGDIVLKQLASNMLSCLREQDIIGRYGGEEFLVVLPNVAIEGAVTVAEKLRAKVENSMDKIIEDIDLEVTISIGVSDNFLSEPKKEDDMLFCADTALYVAKSKGKNCVVVFTPS